MQEIIIRCFGYTKIMQDGHWLSSENFEREIPFRYRYGIDDEHLAKKAWSHAEGKIVEWDEEGYEETVCLSKISLVGENGRFEVDGLHVYPSYDMDADGNHVYE